ncbi:DUF7507 domain-containing protein [Streptomyces smaragdinus]|uniref:DUF7507 domain-containing protein n=1 Tax=Streptomyces smaragdinus TaxID=2585196 RepID=UPI00188698FE|nr:DUF11 domain-containing protein [Streptomyces smaragdinus]
MIALPLVAMAASPAAAQEPWWCPTSGDQGTGYYFEAGEPGYGPATIFEVNSNDGSMYPVGSSQDPVDAVGYNPHDGFFYGVVNGSSDIVRIDRYGNFSYMGGVPFQRAIAGDVDEFGHYWVLSSDGQWAEFDLTTGYAYQVRSGYTPPPPNGRLPGDWTYMRSGPYGPGLYGVSDPYGGGNAHLVYFNTQAPGSFQDLGPVSNLPYLPFPPDPIDHRATYTDGYYLYTHSYSNGITYRIDVFGNYATELPNGAGPRVVGDGAQCGVGGGWIGKGTLNLVKKVEGRNLPDDQFRLNVWSPNTGNVGELVTSGGESHFETGPMPIHGGQDYVIDEWMDGTWQWPQDAGYDTRADCFDPFGNPVNVWGGTGNWTVQIPPMDGDFTCVVTNTAVGADAIDLTKTPDPPVVHRAGDTVDYEFTVRNDGQTALHDIRVEDPLSGTPVPCPVPDGGLLPGQTTTCGFPYTVTAEDVARGYITNNATAIGTSNRDGGEVRDDADARVEVEVQSPALSLDKTANPTTVAAAGEEVTYSYRVVNEGNTVLENVHIDETYFSGTGGKTGIECDDVTLQPAQATTCRSTYTVSQEDIDRGVAIVNAASAVANDPDGTEVRHDDTETVDVTQTPSLDLAKSVEPTTVSNAGEEVRYTFDFVNSGNTTLYDVELVEDDFTGAGAPGPLECEPGWDGTLAPGARMRCTATYVTRQEDIDRGGFDNAAHLTSRTADGDPVDSGSAEAHVDAERRPGVSLEKWADPSDREYFHEGQEITYTYVIRNTGNTSLTGVGVVETEFTGSGGPPQINCPEQTGPLPPNGTVTCYATYTLTQADIDRNEVRNTAHAVGTGPGGQGLESEDAQVILTGEYASGLSLRKSVEPATVNAVGDEVTYSFEVTNTGETTLTGLRILENRFTGSDGPLQIECPAAPLPHGESATCTATYRVTQADLDAGGVFNTATAVADRPDGEDVGSEPDDAELGVTTNASLTLAKTAEPAEVTEAGQEVVYRYTLTNTGNVTLHAPSVTDTEFSGSGEPPRVTCPAETLPPSEEMTCTGRYIVTEADLAAGKITNTAVGAANNGERVTSPPDDATVTTRPAAEDGLALVKKGKHSKPKGRHGRGVIRWKFTVTNTGGTTLTNVVVNDPVAGEVRCPKQTLEPGESMTCEAGPYKVTEDDVRLGHVKNTAVATGRNPAGDEVTSPDATTVVEVPVCDKEHPCKDKERAVV